MLIAFKPGDRVRLTADYHTTRYSSSVPSAGKVTPRPRKLLLAGDVFAVVKLASLTGIYRKFRDGRAWIVYDDERGRWRIPERLLERVEVVNVGTLEVAA